MQSELDKMKSIILTITDFTFNLVVAGASTFFVELDAQNFAADELPPVLTLDLCVIASRDFSVSLDTANDAPEANNGACRKLNLILKFHHFKTVGVLLEAILMSYASIVEALLV